MVLLPLAGMLPLESVTVSPPVEPVTVNPLLPLGLPARTTPLGNVSVKGDVTVAAVLFGLLIVIVNVDVPPAVTEGGVNDSLNTGGGTDRGSA